MSESRVRVGIIGCGYWGPNLVRVFSELEDATVARVCDTRPGRLDFIRKRFPLVEVCTEPFRSRHGLLARGETPIGRKAARDEHG
jgi:predicted dehydrogenase